MADVQELFPTTKASDDSGVALDNAVDATTAAAALNGAVGFAFKDSSGDVILPALTAAGAISVDTGAAGTQKQDEGTVTSTGLDNEDTIATITALTVAKVHTIQFYQTSSYHPTRWAAYYVDDAGGSPVDTLIATWLTGPGDFNHCCSPTCMTFDTTGGTGTQEFQIRGTQLRGAVTDMHAFGCLTEAP